MIVSSKARVLSLPDPYGALVLGQVCVTENGVTKESIVIRNVLGGNHIDITQVAESLTEEADGSVTAILTFKPTHIFREAIATASPRPPNAFVNNTCA